MEDVEEEVEDVDEVLKDSAHWHAPPAMILSDGAFGSDENPWLPEQVKSEGGATGIGTTVEKYGVGVGGGQQQLPLLLGTSVSFDMQVDG